MQLFDVPYLVAFALIDAIGITLVLGARFEPLRVLAVVAIASLLVPIASLQDVGGFGLMRVGAWLVFVQAPLVFLLYLSNLLFRRAAQLFRF